MSSHEVLLDHQYSGKGHPPCGWKLMGSSPSVVRCAGGRVTEETAKARSKEFRVFNKLSSKRLASLPDGPEKKELLYKEHLFHTFQSMKFVRDLPHLDPAFLRTKSVHLRRRPEHATRKTIVFDLDETLVHCVDDSGASCDAETTVQFPNGAVVRVGINVRPHARACLAIASQLFEVVVFTASHRCYADKVLDYLDPERALVHHRLYREHCIPVHGVLLKDLRILEDRLLKDVVIIDNAAYCFGYQLDNGIPILSWYDDPSDKELENLVEYLQILARAEDVRELNRQSFRMKTFYEDYLNEFEHCQLPK